MAQTSIIDYLNELKEDETSEDEGYLGPNSEFVGYSAYIKSSAWKKKRLVVIKKMGNKCQWCQKGGEVLEVHHLHYRTLYRERLEDVQVLCVPCHAQAEKMREHSTKERAHDNAFMTWAGKRYGEESWIHMDEIVLMEEFDDWIKWKEDTDW